MLTFSSLPYTTRNIQLTPAETQVTFKVHHGEHGNHLVTVRQYGVIPNCTPAPHDKTLLEELGIPLIPRSPSWYETMGKQIEESRAARKGRHALAIQMEKEDNNEQ